MMGTPGLRKASQLAILNANYIANQLAEDYSVLYAGEGGYVAHEVILGRGTYLSHYPHKSAHTFYSGDRTHEGIWLLPY